MFTRLMLCGLVTGLTLALPIHGPAQDAAARKLKPGDWVQYEEQAEFKALQMRTVAKVTVTKVDETKGETTRSIEQESKGDIEAFQSLKASMDLCRNMLDADPKSTPKEWKKVTTKEVKEGTETLRIANKEYKCKWVESKGTLGESGEWKRKIWICPGAVPFDQLKGEVTFQNRGFPAFKLTRQVIGYGQAK